MHAQTQWREGGIRKKAKIFFKTTDPFLPAPIKAEPLCSSVGVQLLRELPASPVRRKNEPAHPAPTPSPVLFEAGPAI